MSNDFTLWDYADNFNNIMDVNEGIKAYKAIPYLPKGIALANGLAVAGRGMLLDYLATKPLQMTYESMAHPNHSRVLPQVSNSNMVDKAKLEAYRGSMYTPSIWNYKP